jgi:cobyric acid synthase
LHGLFDSAEGLQRLLSFWRRICGKEESKPGFFDPLAERERRYDALADHYRSNLKMDVIHRVLSGHQ